MGEECTEMCRSGSPPAHRKETPPAAVAARAAVDSLARAAGFAGTVIEHGAGSARSAAVDYIRADIGRIGAAIGWTPVHDLDASTKAIWEQIH